MAFLRQAAVMCTLFATAPTLFSSANDTVNKTEKTWGVAELRKLSASFKKPVDPKSTSAQLRKDQAERDSALPTGKQFIIKGKVRDVVERSETQPRKTTTDRKDSGYLVTVVYESAQKYTRRVAIGGGFHVAVREETTPVERIEVRITTTDDSLLRLKQGQPVEVAGTIKSIAVGGKDIFIVTVESSGVSTPAGSDRADSKHLAVVIESDDARVVVTGRQN